MGYCLLKREEVPDPTGMDEPEDIMLRSKPVMKEQILYYSAYRMSLESDS